MIQQLIFSFNDDRFIFILSSSQCFQFVDNIFSQFFQGWKIKLFGSDPKPLAAGILIKSHSRSLSLSPDNARRIFSFIVRVCVSRSLLSPRSLVERKFRKEPRRAVNNARSLQAKGAGARLFYPPSLQDCVYVVPESKYVGFSTLFSSFSLCMGCRACVK